jgi:hypothetical protein
MENPIEGPLARELREIGEGKRDFPKTTARRHHFVPAFLLAQFAAPRGDRRGFMAQLDTRSGKPQKTTPNAACFERDLYAQESDEGRDTTLEAFFSIVENHGAPAIQRLIEDPLNLSPEDRETLSYYLAFQYNRSPVVLDQLSNMAEATSMATFAVHFEDAVGFRNVYQEAIDAEASDEEIEHFRHYMRERLHSGEIRTRNPKAQAFDLMLGTADAVAETIHQLQWTLVKAGEDEFVISDRALAMHDSQPRFPWSGHGLRSSPKAQTMVPLAPEHALLLESGPPRMGHATVGASRVRKINLGTYGYADRFIYARNQAVVQHVRRQAKQYRADVVRPRPMRQVMLEDADPNDPTVGREHVRRGWPRGLWVKDDDGRPQFVAYTALEPGHAKPGKAAVAGAEIGRRVIERAISDGLATPDRLGALESPSRERDRARDSPPRS